jgi:glyoxylase-like metal-dependent hydrolase (beta-lactamase superfamily II)
MWELPDRWLQQEQQIDLGDRVLHALPTPGHTAPHVDFADHERGVLFAGDHVLPTITPSVGFELVFADNPLEAFLGSLRTVRELPDLAVLPAHGPVGMSSHQRVDELVHHHEVRLDLCRAAAAGGATAYDVARQLPWTRHEHRLDDLDLFNAALATLETRAHLELLVARDELTRTPSDDGIVYSPA